MYLLKPFFFLVSFKTFDGKICVLGGQWSLQCDIPCTTPF